MIGLQCNYYALMLAIFNPRYTVDKSMNVLMPKTIVVPEIRRQRKNVTQEIIEEIRQMNKRGVSQPRIAGILGISTTTVSRQLRKEKAAH